MKKKIIVMMIKDENFRAIENLIFCFRLGFQNGNEPNKKYFFKCKCKNKITIYL